MANINVVSLAGEKVGEFELADYVFSAGINDALLWEAVKHYRAALRQGTAATKTRKNVSGSGKKLWKQKGTGPRAYRFDSQPALALRRYRSWTSAAQL